MTLFIRAIQRSVALVLLPHTFVVHDQSSVQDAVPVLMCCACSKRHYFCSHDGLRLQKMDPQMRKLLEVTHEAFVDSGVDYKSLRGSSRVGVYLGCCGSEVHAMWLSDYNNITGYEQTGCTLSMFANRLSFFFDFKGPSKAVDTGVLQAHSL